LLDPPLGLVLFLAESNATQPRLTARMGWRQAAGRGVRWLRVQIDAAAIWAIGPGRVLSAHGRHLAGFPWP